MASQPLRLTGSCVCRNLTYTLTLSSKDEARTSLCHCGSCKKAFGGAFGLTIKVPISSFKYDESSGKPTLHTQDNGVHREFCHTCGAYVCEYGEGAKNDFRYLALGSLDDPEALPPKGEFFCSQRASWMPEVPGTFKKQEIKQ